MPSKNKMRKFCFFVCSLFRPFRCHCIDLVLSAHFKSSSLKNHLRSFFFLLLGFGGGDAFSFFTLILLNWALSLRCCCCFNCVCVAGSQRMSSVPSTNGTFFRTKFIASHIHCVCHSLCCLASCDTTQVPKFALRSLSPSDSIHKT